MRARLRDALTGAAAGCYPKGRRADALVVRDCARDAVDAGGSWALAREPLSLAAAGLRARTAAGGRELASAPWRSALELLTLPLAAALLTLWVFGFVPRYDHWPLGEGWALLLGGSLAAVVGAALGLRLVLLAGSLATLVAAIAPHFGYGTEFAFADTPSFFDAGRVDLAAASVLPNLLLIAAALSMSGGVRRPPLVAAGRVALGILPAALALVVLLPAPELIPASEVPPAREVAPGVFMQEQFNYPAPWVFEAPTFMRAFGIALALAVVISWRRVGRQPAAALATGLVVASVGYPLMWVLMQREATPYWAYTVPYRVALTALPVVLAVALMRRAGRAAGTLRN